MMLAANNSPYKNYYNPEPKEPEFGGLVKAIALAVFLILLILSFYGCNPVQKVLTDPAKFEQVGQKWAALNPCVNDTLLQYVPGDSIITTNTDTIRYAWVFNDTIVREKVVTKVTKVTKMDTIVKIVTDNRKLEIATIKINAITGDLTASKSKVEQLQTEIKKREKWLLFSALLIFILGIIIGKLI